MEPARDARDLLLFGDVLGFTPMETLVAATRMGGEIMGMANELGQIKLGYLADVLPVDGNPLADIKRQQDQDALLVIMKDGRLHKAPAYSPLRRRQLAAQQLLVVGGRT